MQRLSQVLLYDFCLVRFGGFDFPDQPIRNHVGGCGSIFLAAADELHGHTRHRERLGRLVFVRPDVEVWRDDDLSPRLFHTNYYTATEVAKTRNLRAAGFLP